MLTELGPFWPNPDGRTLTENVYSWNKIANVIFLESPRRVGFSYQNLTENSDDVFNDKKTASDNFLALMDFLSVYPEYYDRPFYVTGESYAGVYIPTLVSLIIDKIQAGEAPGLNLVGVMIGNGKMSDKWQFNSIISLLYNRGVYNPAEMNELSGCCNKSEPLRDCDFSQWVKFDSHGDAHPINDSAGQETECGKKRIATTVSTLRREQMLLRAKLRQKQPQQKDLKLMDTSFEHYYDLKGFYDQKVNYASTDSEGAFQCYNTESGEQWLNWDDVRAALHISAAAAPYSECSDYVFERYIKQNSDTSPVFDHIVESGYKLRLLVYNGDLDTSCNFVGDEWFMEALASRHSMPQVMDQQPWWFRDVIAGYYQRFTYQQSFTVDILTVKGAGHMVPTDRPGPTLQMFKNFLDAERNYSIPLPFGRDRRPLKPEYETLLEIAALESPAVMLPFRVRRSISAEQLPKQQASLVAPPNGSKEHDRIEELPGLTFDLNFAQYAGYLTGADSENYLYYWLVESQNEPEVDPLIVWLNGGPGCSSLRGLMEEIGPFRASRNGSRLFENPFAWNKVSWWLLGYLIT
ncbi:unnamed protein product [Anisakis simplex]|uniref:Carboxypeptidase n=1 Tax=Anisakis simplex TaxID=6269 RepID=A0A3P6PFK9_ANISI|nr:unnamed protein product [Anisakis simplex]